MKLYLIQHGKAKTKDEEPQRGLNKDGIAETIKTASLLYKTDPPPLEIFHSDKLRARQTAELFAEKLINKIGIREHPQLAPNDSVEPLLKEIRNSSRDLLIVGHLPYLSFLISRLLSGKDDACPVQFRNSAVIHLERRDGKWLIKWVIHPDIP